MKKKNRPKEFNRCECFQRWLSTKMITMEPTIQELETRKVIQNQYKIYNSETGNIQKGYMEFHSNSSSFIMIYLILKGNIV